MNKWNFYKFEKKPNSAGTSIKDALKTSKHKNESLLARESIQNSSDAKNKKDDMVKVVFRKTTLTGKTKANFLESMGIEEIRNRKEAIKELNPSNNTLHDSNDDGELNLLYIDDFNTHGLYGSLKGENYQFSNLFKLILQQSDPDKAYNLEDSQGSYGLGKAAYSSNSKISTIAVYSNFRDQFIDPRHKKKNYFNDEGINTAFIGASYFSKHLFKGLTYTGISIWSKTWQRMM